MKTVLMDASSSILLYKAGLIETMLAHYHGIMPPSVYDEITVQGYPGEPVFVSLHARGLIRIEAALDSDPLIPDSMGPGETDTIALFRSYPHAFVLIDDGKGARWCRQQNIPYINALLVPKLLYHSGWLDKSDHLRAMARLTDLGRYSPGILAYARTATPETLTIFLCEANHDTDASISG